jgi:hypothetical protein
MIGILSKFQGLPGASFAAPRFDYASRQNGGALRKWLRN